MSRRDDNFLRRWSRLKQEASTKTEATGKPAIAATPGELPPLASLSFESDFRGFMHAEVDQAMRRAALKKLFSDPRFNVMDGLDVYIDDYSRDDPIPPGMLAQLQHARTTLFGPRPSQDVPAEDEQLPEVPAEAEAAEPEADHGAARQDA